MVATTLLYLVRHAEQQHPPAGEDADGGLSAVGNGRRTGWGGG